MEKDLNELKKLIDAFLAAPIEDDDALLYSLDRVEANLLHYVEIPKMHKRDTSCRPLLTDDFIERLVAIPSNDIEVQLKVISCLLRVSDLRPDSTRLPSFQTMLLKKFPTLSGQESHSPEWRIPYIALNAVKEDPSLAPAFLDFIANGSLGKPLPSVGYRLIASSIRTAPDKLPDAVAFFKKSALELHNPPDEGSQDETLDESEQMNEGEIHHLDLSGFLSCAVALYREAARHKKTDLCSTLYDLFNDYPFSSNRKGDFCCSGASTHFFKLTPEQFRGVWIRRINKEMRQINNEQPERHLSLYEAPKMPNTGRTELTPMQRVLCCA